MRRLARLPAGKHNFFRPEPKGRKPAPKRHPNSIFVAQMACERCGNVVLLNRYLEARCKRCGERVGANN